MSDEAVKKAKEKLEPLGYNNLPNGMSRVSYYVTGAWKLFSWLIIPLLTATWLFVGTPAYAAGPIVNQLATSVTAKAPQASSSPRLHESPSTTAPSSHSSGIQLPAVVSLGIDQLGPKLAAPAVHVWDMSDPRSVNLLTKELQSVRSKAAAAKNVFFLTAQENSMLIPMEKLAGKFPDITIVVLPSYETVNAATHYIDPARVISAGFGRSHTDARLKPMAEALLSGGAEINLFSASQNWSPSDEVLIGLKKVKFESLATNLYLLDFLKGLAFFSPVQNSIETTVELLKETQRHA
jgi:hypothetical protein